MFDKLKQHLPTEGKENVNDSLDSSVNVANTSNNSCEATIPSGTEEGSPSGADHSASTSNSSPGKGLAAGCNDSPVLARLAENTALPSIQIIHGSVAGTPAESPAANRRFLHPNLRRVQEQELRGSSPTPSQTSSGSGGGATTSDKRPG